ncbi:BrnT family toxin [Peteryoungia desertarenae]|uniref:BrnT family toxin n=1 Tax=Peteryoungia desertarenae TaxID=1813451 RepID=A0ABX6QR53_9HYPH|nr:BrnT family toxin [Peteryoungia desertarenae]QLF71015.1 BrnT family toxin [Peteryoungia desertarenae]
MDFEFDPGKSASNKDKHDVDFVEAQALWLDKLRLIVPAKYVGEQRYALIAEMDGLLWVAVYVLRGETVRLISVRRARAMEKERYEDYNRSRIR